MVDEGVHADGPHGLRRRGGEWNHPHDRRRVGQRLHLHRAGRILRSVHELLEYRGSNAHAAHERDRGNGERHRLCDRRPYGLWCHHGRRRSVQPRDEHLVDEGVALGAARDRRHRSGQRRAVCGWRWRLEQQSGRHRTGVRPGHEHLDDQGANADGARPGPRRRRERHPLCDRRHGCLAGCHDSRGLRPGPEHVEHQGFHADRPHVRIWRRRVGREGLRGGRVREQRGTGYSRGVRSGGEYVEHRERDAHGARKPARRSRQRRNPRLGRHFRLLSRHERSAEPGRPGTANGARRAHDRPCDRRQRAGDREFHRAG